MRLTALPVLAAVMNLAAHSFAPAQRPQEPLFKTGTNLVVVTVVVQNRNGEPVTNLTRDDFVLMDSGQQRGIAEFHTEAAPAYVALLLDLSGSMDVASKMDDARQAARQVLTWLQPERDRAALFGFETSLTEVVPFSAPLGEVDHALDTLKPFGSTSLYDAIAAAGKRVAAESGPRRAVVAITDGADNSSRLLPADVANLASSIDVPIYVIAVVLPIDRPGDSKGGVDVGADKILASPLGALARATGGELFAVSTPSHASIAARQIITALRTQYVLSFDPGTTAAGFRSLQVLTRKRDLVVRARSGYQAGPAGTPTRHH